MIDGDVFDGLINKGASDEAVRLATRAAAAGDATAQYCLATWKLIGSFVPRDLVAARQLLKLSAESNADAAHLEIALTANGTGGVRDWPEALRLLERAAVSDPVARQHLGLLRRMSLGEDGQSSARFEPLILSATPYVAIYSGLLSPSECTHLAQAGADLLRPSLVVHPITRRALPDPIRTSDSAVIGPMREDLVVAAINRRIAAMTETDISCGEPLALLRYERGQEYRPHMDVLPGVANQRAVTAIVYLNDGYDGGETTFPAVGLDIRARAGDVLVFHNLTRTGEPDLRSQHAGRPVTSGSKWITTRWIRQRPIDVWNMAR